MKIIPMTEIFVISMIFIVNLKITFLKIYCHLLKKLISL